MQYIIHVLYLILMFETMILKKKYTKDISIKRFLWTGLTPSISGVRVKRSLALCVSFVDRCLSFCTFSLGHYIFCSPSIYEYPIDIFKLFRYRNNTQLASKWYRYKNNNSSKHQMNPLPSSNKFHTFMRPTNISTDE
jgi:hypothetical protein